LQIPYLRNRNPSRLLDESKREAATSPFGCLRYDSLDSATERVKSMARSSLWRVSNGQAQASQMKDTASAMAEHHGKGQQIRVKFGNKRFYLQERLETSYFRQNTGKASV